MYRDYWLIFLALFFVGCDRTVVPREDRSQGEGQAVSVSDSVEGDSDSGLLERDSTSVPLASLLEDPSVPGESDSGLGDESSQASSLSQQSGNKPATDGQSSQGLVVSGDSSDQAESWTLPVSPVKSSDPDEMARHLSEIEKEIRNLVATSRRMDEEDAQRAAVELSQMKLNAAQHLGELPDLSPDQRRLARKARLVALSHLSGLKDVRAAKQLVDFAKELLSEEDAELRHQAEIVLFGFQIQELQNGLLEDPTPVVDSARRLLDNPAFRGRLEMTSLGHAISVLYQMGFSSQASQVEQLAFEVFSDSPDRELRNESWNQLTQTSQSVANFVNSLQSLGSSPSDAALVMAAARNMVEQHPNPVTLEMIAGIVADLEYGGQLNLSMELTELVDVEMKKYEPGASATAVTATLAEHRQRVGWLGQRLSSDKLQSLRLIDTNGVPLDPSTLEGKVVLIDFWATWCLPCIQEIPHIRRAHEELSNQGFQVLSINMDKDPSKLIQFMQSNRFPWKTYRSEGGDQKLLTEEFGITLFPHTMLVGPDGTVSSLHVRGEKLIAEVERLLEQ